MEGERLTFGCLSEREGRIACNATELNCNLGSELEQRQPARIDRYQFLV